MHAHELWQLPTPIEVNADLANQKGVSKPSTSTHSRCHVFPSMNMVKNFKVVPSLWHRKNVVISSVGHYMTMELCYWRFMFKIKASKLKCVF